MTKVELTKEHLVLKIKELTTTLGRVPTVVEFKKAFVGIKVEEILSKHFGSFSNLLSVSSLHRTIDTPRAVEVIPPPSLDGYLTASEIIEQNVRRFKKKIESHKSKKWAPFKVMTDQPIGLCVFGDPHLDNKGTHWPLLLEHTEICRTTPGMFGMNIGDTHDNWVGRLVAQYAESNVSRKDTWKLIEWFLKDSGVNWLIWLLGNHDSWNFGDETMSKLVKNVCIMEDWRAQFKLVFDNGREVLIDAAHNHKGHSQWNSLHGQQKAASMGGIAHVYIAGHLHNWALAQNECPHTGRIYHLARARGYKHIDAYGENLGFGSQNEGSSIVIVIDPRAKDINLVRCFADVREGADYLTYLRSKK